jgi:hypothetical protein
MKDNWMHGKLIDPPSGWQHGFPRQFRPEYPNQSLESWLRGTNYPSKDIPLALKHSRILG